MFIEGLVSFLLLKRVVLEPNANHPFFVVDGRRWVDAGELSVGDRVALAGGGVARVESSVTESRFVRVHNLTVDRDHTFLVTQASKAAGAGGVRPKAGGVNPSTAVVAHNCPPSYHLGRNMEAERTTRPPESAAHHIVQQGKNVPGIQDTHNMMSGLGVHVDEASNGVFLPRFESSPNPNGKVVHSTLHSPKYREAVYAYLMVVKPHSAEDLRARLRFLGNSLENGTLTRDGWNL